MGLTVKLAVSAVLAVGILVPSAAGSPSADLDAVVRDYASDKRITPCRFTLAQLQGVRAQLGDDAETYAQGIGAAVDREIKRWKDGGCTAKKVAAAAGAAVRIVSIQSAGGASQESVTIKNVGKKAVNLKGYALRDAGDHTLKLRSTTLRKGAKLRVLTGCAKGHRSALRKGTRYYACRSKEVWDDAGDVVELLGKGGGLLSRKQYGTPPA